MESQKPIKRRRVQRGSQVHWVDLRSLPREGLDGGSGRKEDQSKPRSEIFIGARLDGVRRMKIISEGVLWIRLHS